MPWLTAVLNKPVVAPSGARIGRVQDLVASRTGFPRVTAVLVKVSKSGRELVEADSGKAFFSWDCVDEINGQLRLCSTRTLEQEPTQELYLRDDLLDRQIVDTNGARVVRVNDVLLSETAGGLSVVGADVGFKGVLRGLGLERLADRLAGALGYEIPGSLIAWNYVAPLDEDRRQVKLTVPSRLLKELHPSELADILDQLDPELRQKTISMMSITSLAETLPETEPEISRQAFEVITEERARRVVELMPPDEAADLLGSLGYDKSQRLLSLMGVSFSSVLKELLGYPPESAGGRMTPSFVAISRELTVGQAIHEIRSQAMKAETIYYTYVVSEDGRLEGVISLRDLLRSGPDRPVSEVMEPDVVSVGLADDQEVVATAMVRYNLLAVPVTDEERRVKGIVTVDDIVDVLEQEASEDLSEVTGVYLGEGIRSTTGRLAGFGVSILGGAAAAVLLEAQRPVLASVSAVAWLLPLYLRMAQDLGTWSLARAFLSDNLSPRARFDALAQEMLAALATAGLSGVLVGTFGTWWTGSFTAGALLGVGIFVGSLVASIVGLFLPSMARSVGLHRLVSKGRFLAVIVALASILVYVWALSALAGRMFA